MAKFLQFCRSASVFASSKIASRSGVDSKFSSLIGDDAMSTTSGDAVFVIEFVVVGGKAGRTREGSGDRMITSWSDWLLSG